MAFVRVQHRVQDYDTWKQVFDGFHATRKSAGEKSYHIWQTEDDPNDLNLLFEWDNAENAHSFMASSELKDAMNKAGVLEHPRIDFLKEIDRGKL
jgi:quinol monooxygenase YgiN